MLPMDLRGRLPCVYEDGSGLLASQLWEDKELAAVFTEGITRVDVIIHAGDFVSLSCDNSCAGRVIAS